MTRNLSLIAASLFSISQMQGASLADKAKDVPPPNIIWLNCEDIGPNLGCYGDQFATTPNIDNLSQQGVVYERAYATAPICSPSRSCLITGLYATSLGTQQLRCEIERPDFIKTLPNHLAESGYFTSNNLKTDYNFDPNEVWEYWKDDNAPWRQRKSGQPFFSMFVFGMTHEGSVNHTSQWEKNTRDLPRELFHDPAGLTVPPQYPDTPEIRKIWTHYYDNITVFDQVVGEIVQNLKDDGLLEETIIFVFSDHGAGLPRYKRWLNVTGLHVPLVVYAPDKYKDLVRTPPGIKDKGMVSFVDFAPTVLSLAGATVPSTMQGQPFMGHQIAPPRSHVIGARDRADNMYEMSRAILTGNYFYVRHYYPYLPYIQPGVMFGDSKECFRELRRLKNEGQLSGVPLMMWGRKPIEELYDLDKDPAELNNLSADPKYRGLMDGFKEEIHEWALSTRDTGYLTEAEYMIRSEGSTPYEMAHNPKEYDLEKIIDAAEMVGTATPQELIAKFADEDSGVRYWAVIGIQALGEKGEDAVGPLDELLGDPSPSVQIAAAEALCRLGISGEAIPVLEKWVQDDRGWLALQAARSIELIGERARPLVPVLFKVIDKYKATDPDSKMRYKDFNFAAFITWSAEAALQEMGEDMGNIKITAH